MKNVYDKCCNKKSILNQFGANDVFAQGVTVVPL